MKKPLVFLSTFIGTAFAADFSEEALSRVGAKRTCIPSTTDFTAERCFYTYIPECAGENVPLVFDIHGYGGSPVALSRYSGWIKKADENCFVVVMPSGNTVRPLTMSEDTACFAMPAGLTIDDGNKEAGTCCCGTFRGATDPADTDDETFLQNAAVAAIQEVIPEETANSVTIDTKRIYMAGHSNGCITSIAMGTLHSNLVAAVCCHAGVAQAVFPSNYEPTPMFVAFGTGDTTVDFEGEWDVLGAVETYETISDANGCTYSTDTTINESGNTGKMYVAEGCENDASVELYTIDDVGHFPYLNMNGTKVDTTQLAWDFCSQYSNAEIPAILGGPSIDDDEPDKQTDDAAPEDDVTTPEDDAILEDDDSAASVLLGISSNPFKSFCLV